MATVACAREPTDDCSGLEVPAMLGNPFEAVKGRRRGTVTTGFAHLDLDPGVRGRAEGEGWFADRRAGFEAVS